MIAKNRTEGEGGGRCAPRVPLPPFLKSISGSDTAKDSISKETYAKFVERVENLLLSYPVEPIDSIMKSIPKRISQVIQNKGYRLKY